MQEVVTAYKDTEMPKKVQSTGLHIAGEKYIVIKADDTSLYGKKVSEVPHKGQSLSLPGPTLIGPAPYAHSILRAYKITMNYYFPACDMES